MDMEAERRLVLIRKNIDALSNCSTNFDQVISKLVGFEVISNDTAEQLQAPGITTYNRFSQLYAHHIPKGGPLTFNSLLIAFISLNNIQAVQLLTGKSIDDLEDIGITKFTHPKDFTVNVVKGPAPEHILFVESISLNKRLQPLSPGGFGNNVGPAAAPPPPKEQVQVQVQLNDHNVPLSEFDLLKVGDVLQKSPKIYDKWPTIVRRLLQNNKKDFDKPKDKTFDVWINDTLEEWVSLEGSKATFGKFLECLISGGSTQAAELLEKEIKDIKK